MQKHTINISESARKQLKSKMGGRSGGIRIGIKPSGCSAFGYTMEYEEHPLEDDVVHTETGINIYINQESFFYIEGLSIDYKDNKFNKKFVFINPNAINSCGCGESFDV